MKPFKARVLLESCNITFIHFISPLPFYPEFKTIDCGEHKEALGQFSSHMMVL